MAIVVPIVADVSGLTRGLNSSQSSLKRFGKMAALAAGAAGIGALVAVTKIGISELNDQQKVLAQTNAVLASTKSIANVTAKQMGNLSQAIMEKTGIDDEAIQSGQNLLLTFTKIRNETGRGNDIFNQATMATTNLSVAMGKDLSSSAILVGKALNDPIKGVGALSRAGVQFTESQKETIKAMVDSGNVMGAQKMILKELETQFGGSAIAAGKTLSGQLNIAKETFRNLAGEMVATFLPTLARVAGAVAKFFLDFAKQPTLSAKVQFVLGKIGAGFDSIWEWWTKSQRKELPARVIITPAGKDQVAKFFSDLQAKMEAQSYKTGEQVGKWIANGIINGFRGQRDRAQSNLIADLTYVYSGAWVQEIGVKFAEGLWKGFSDTIKEKVPGIAGLFGGSPGDSSKFQGQGEKAGKQVKAGVAKALTGGPRLGLSNLITDEVRSAVQSARQSLNSLASGIVSRIDAIRQASFRVGGTGANAPELLKKQRDLEDRQYAISKANAEKELAESENKTEAQLALDQLLFDRESVLRQRGIEDEQAATQTSIDSLVEKFNTGIINATQFQTELNTLLGSNFGTELGIGFAGAFKREFDSLIAEVKGIELVSSMIPGGTTISPTGSTAVGALNQANQDRFETALEKYNNQRNNILGDIQTIEKNIAKQKGGATEAQKNLLKKLRANLAKLVEPKRSAYGLALGGILKKQVFTAGEAGAEAVIPLNSTSAMNMLRDALGGNAAASTNVYNLTVNAGLGTDPDELGRVIVESIKRFEKRNGQAFSAPLLSVTSNVAGQTSAGSAKTDFNRVTTLRKG